MYVTLWLRYARARTVVASTVADCVRFISTLGVLAAGRGRFLACFFDARVVAACMIHVGKQAGKQVGWQVWEDGFVIQVLFM